MKSLHVAVILPLVLVLAACGFQLRGSENPLHKYVSSVRLVIVGRDQPFHFAVRQTLTSSRININDTSSNVLEILRTQNNKRTASYSSRAKSAEFELIKTVTFRFTRDKQEVIAPMTLETRRSYLYRETAAIGKAEEETLLRQEMDNDLAQRILLALQRAAEASREDNAVQSPR